MTTNFTPEAREVLGRHIERRIAEVIAEYGSEEFVLFDEGYGW